MVDFNWTRLVGGIIGDTNDTVTQLTNEQLAAILINMQESSDVWSDVNLDVDAQIEELLGDAADEVELDVDSILGSISELVGSVDASLDDMLGNVDQHLKSAADDVLGGISQASQGVIANINAQTQDSIGLLEGIGADILGGISVNVDDVLGSVGETAQQILGFIGTDSNAALDAVRRVADEVGLTTEGILRNVTDQVEETIGSIDGSLSESVDSATQAQEQTRDVLSEQSEQQLEASEAQAESIRQGIEESLDVLGSQSDSALSEVAESTDAQTRATTEGAASITDMIGQSAENIANPLETLKDIWTFGGDAPTEEARNAALEGTRDVLRGLGVPEEQTDEFVRVIEETTKNVSGVTLRLTFMLLNLVGYATFMQESASVAITPRLQQLARSVPSSLPGPGELLDMRNRDLIDDGIATELFRLQGYSEQIAGAFLAARRQYPELGIIQSWFLREFVSREHAEQLLERQGFDQEDTDKLIEMSFYIPPPQDIILWAVREVFNISQAQRFGQFDEFPEAFAELASKQGISREFAQNYWASHWRMPSLTRLFEMYHRKIIDEDTLRLTIKSHDYTPFWREPLIAVAYKPLTRVDVRRMHDLGLISEQELQSRYEDLGFSPQDAAMMTQFTVEYNAEPAAESPEVIEQVARQPVLNLYRDGVFSEEEAVERLVELGMPEAEAQVFIGAENLERERVERQQQKDLVVAQAKAGALTFEEAFDELSRLGFEPRELDIAVTEIQRARVAATKIPTREELDTMFSKGLISESDYVDALQRIGYAPFWVQRFLALQREKMQ